MSAGAPFALGIAHLLPSNIHQVAIVSGFAPLNKENKKHLSKPVKAMLNLAKSLPFLLKVLLRMQVKQLNKNPTKALQDFLKIMSPPDQDLLKNPSIMKVIETMFKEAFKKGSQGVAHEISNVLVQEWDFELDNIKVPVTFWQGTKDNNVPHQWASFMANKIAGANLRTFSDEGHLIIFSHASEIFAGLASGEAHEV